MAFDLIFLSVCLVWWPVGLVACLIYNRFSPCPIGFVDQGDLIFKIAIWPITLLCGFVITRDHMRRNRRVHHHH